MGKNVTGRKEAIEKIREIQKDPGDVCLWDIPEHIQKGRELDAPMYPHDLYLGMEYGAIVVLMQLFDISPEDL